LNNDERFYSKLDGGGKRATQPTEGGPIGNKVKKNSDEVMGGGRKRNAGKVGRKPAPVVSGLVQTVVNSAAANDGNVDFEVYKRARAEGYSSPFILDNVLNGLSQGNHEAIKVAKAAVERGEAEVAREAAVNTRKERLALCMTLLLHASTCMSTACASVNCMKMKGLLTHRAGCMVKAKGGCVVCKRIGALLQLHARKCNKDDCSVPYCVAIRERYREQTVDNGANKGSKDDILPSAIKSGATVKAEFDTDTDDEDGLKPSATTSGAIVKSEFDAETDDEDDRKPDTVMSRVAVKIEEYFADTDDEDGEKQEDVDSVALTDDEREQGDAKRQKVAVLLSNPRSMDLLPAAKLIQAIDW